MGPDPIRSFVLALLLGLLSPAAAASDAAFIPLGDLPGGVFYSQAFSTTNDGELFVSGGSQATNGLEIFRWSESLGMESLGDLPGGIVSGEARGISADGATIVGFSESASGIEGFRWTEGGGLEGLGDLSGGGFGSRAWAVSPDGSIIAGEATGPEGTVAVRWTEAGGFEPLGDLPGGGFSSQAFALTPDGTRLVGTSAGAGGLRPFLWTEGVGMVELGAVPGGQGTGRAKAITPDGSVIVGFADAPGGFEAFRWTEAGGMASIGDLPGGNVFGQANGVSADGRLVGGVGATGNPAVPFTFEAFLWTERDGIRRLKDVLEEDYGLDLTGWIPWEVLSITPDGHAITGIAFNPDGDREAFVALLPYTDCHDGLDGDGDGLIDLDDPACQNLADDSEEDACQNGIDDDGDSLVDFDGGVSIHGGAVAAPDPACTGKAWRKTEASRCGLGFEVLPALLALQRWRRGRHAPGSGRRVAAA